MSKVLSWLNAPAKIERATVIGAVCAFAIGVAAVSLTGCKSSADRMYECESQGISRDTCYLSEQQRKQGMNEQAQAQAYRNAAAAVTSDSSSGHHKHHHSED